MSIEGVGIDLVGVSRLTRLVEEWGEKFLNRVYTEEELDYCISRRNRYEHLAGRFAVKEAVIKAVGKKLPWKSIEVAAESNGRPYVMVDNGKVSSKKDIHVSITHLKDYALAIAVLES